MITVEVEVEGLGHRGPLFRVTHAGEVIVSSAHDPDHTAARALLARGFTGPFQTVIGGTPSMRYRSIEKTAGFAISEEARAGLKRVKYRDPSSRLG